MRSSRPPFRLSAEGLVAVFDHEDVSAFLTLGYLVTVLVPAVMAALLLLLHVSTPWSFAAGGTTLAWAALYALFLRDLSTRERVIVTGAFFATIASAFLFAGLVYDVGWDAMTYHAEAILGLLHGVNPNSSSFHGNFSIFTDHYPKMPWYFAAAAGGALRWPEAGKAYGLLLLFACATYAWRFFRGLGLDLPSALILVLATALSPIAASQILSFYVDGALASLMSLLLLAILRHLDGPDRPDRAVLVLAAAAASTTKFTGAAYACAALGVLGITLLVFPAKRRSLGAFVFSLGPMALLLLILGYNPYITNIRQGHSPGYPAVGKDKVAVVAGNTQGPAEYFLPQRNRLENLVSSIFSATSQAQGAESAPIKIPLTVRLKEIKVSANPDMRTGGWGVLFSGVLVLSLGLFLYARGWRRFPWITGFGLLLVLATTLTNPYTYWARLVPQIGILPLFLLIPCFLSAQRGIRRAAMVVAGLSLVNSLLLAGMGLQSEVRGTLRARRSLQEIAQRCGPGDYTFDDGRTLVRYDLLPAVHGVRLHAVRLSPDARSEGTDLPIELISGRRDTVHTDHCVPPVIP